MYSFSQFRYNSATHEATWTLPTALGVDQLMLALDGTGPSGVHATTSNIPLMSNLGMGFSVLPGDVDGDGVVTVLDAVDVLNRDRWAISRIPSGRTWWAMAWST